MLPVNLSTAKTPGSVEERLEIRQGYKEKLLIKALITLIMLWFTLFWLSLYRTSANLLIVGIPILSIYLYVFYRFHKKYRRLKCEINELEALKRKEEYHKILMHRKLLYFCRD